MTCLPVVEGVQLGTRKLTEYMRELYEDSGMPEVSGYFISSLTGPGMLEASCRVTVEAEARLYKLSFRILQADILHLAKSL